MKEKDGLLVLLFFMSQSFLPRKERESQAFCQLPGGKIPPSDPDIQILREIFQSICCSRSSRFPAQPAHPERPADPVTQFQKRIPIPLRTGKKSRLIRHIPDASSSGQAPCLIFDYGPDSVLVKSILVPNIGPECLSAGKRFRTVLFLLKFCCPIPV